MLPEAYKTVRFYSEKNGGTPAYLSILLSEQTFMYALFDAELSLVSELCHIYVQHPSNTNEAIGHLVNNYQLMQHKFSRINIAVLNSDFTLLPEAYAEDSNVKSLLGFTTGNSLVKSPSTHHLKNVQFCYTAENDALNFLERSFPNASVRHCGAASIDLLFSHHSLAHNNLFLNITDDILEITARKETELLFYNVFKIESNEDILYYLLFMMEQFSLDPKSARLAIASQIPATSDLILTIKKYIRHVELCVTDPTVRLRGDLLSMPQHYYFILLNQHLCAL